jgi:hypothetical protein
MQDETFQKRLCAANRDVVKHTVNRLPGMASDALTVLHGIMMNANESAPARISAVRLILESTFRLQVIEQWKKQVEELKEFIRAKQAQGVFDLD